MEKFTKRTEILIGKEGIKKLETANVAVFGVGGVGGNACEALVRAGIGEITIVDGDTVDVTNINRQIFATVDTIGLDKVEAGKKRLLDINPSLVINPVKLFYLEETKGSFDFSKYDYVLDCVDTVSAKLSIICECKRVGTPVISAMGAGNKLDPARFEVSDIYKTSVCPLARVMRKELKSRGIKNLKVVYSKEEPVVSERPPGSISFVPSVMGLIMAGEVVKELAL